MTRVHYVILTIGIQHKQSTRHTWAYWSLYICKRWEVLNSISQMISQTFNTIIQEHYFSICNKSLELCNYIVLFFHILLELEVESYRK